jgi:hypothetical protein
MALSYSNNMFSYYTMLNNQRIQVIVHHPDKFINNYISTNSHSPSSAAISRNSSSGSLSYGFGQSSPQSQQMSEAFSLIKGKVIDVFDNMVNDYSLPKTIQDIQKRPPLFAIINELLVDDTQTKTIKKYWDVEAQEEIYEVNYN